MKRSALKIVGTTVGVLAGLILFSTCCTSCLVNAFAFHPTPGADPHRIENGEAIEPVSIRTSDEVKISAFFLPRTDAKTTLLFFHGNAGNASHRLGDAETLRSLGVSVLLVDYRGFGLSEGRASEKGVYLDAEAARAFLSQQHGTPPSRIVLYGRSIGSTVAVDLASKHRFKGVILVSPFASGRDMAPAFFRPFIGRPFDSIGKIERVTAPLLILHGDRDSLIPIEMGRRLYARARGDKRFVALKGADHNDITFVAGDQFFSEIGKFLNRI